MLRDPKLRSELESLIRERHYSPEYAVSRALRRYAKVFQTVQNSFLADGPATSSTSKSGCCGICSAAAARSSRSSLRPSSCWPTISPPAKRPISIASSSAALSPKSAAPAATPPSSPRRSNSGRRRHRPVPDRRLGRRPGDHRRRPGAGDPAARRGNARPLRRQIEAAARRRRALETLRDLPAETADGVRIAADGQHRISARGRALRRARQRRHRPVPHRVSVSHVRSRADRRRPLRGLLPRRASDGRSAGGHPHARHGRRQAQPGRWPTTSAIRSSGLRSIRLSLRNLPLFRTQLRAILAGQRPGRRADHVPADLHAAGTAAGQDGLGRRDGRSRGEQHPVQSRKCRSA